MTTPFLVLSVHARMCERESDLHATHSHAHIPSAQHKKTSELSSGIRYGYYTLKIT